MPLIVNSIPTKHTNQMKRVIVFLIALSWPIVHFSQIPDSIFQIINKYETVSYPGRIDSVIRSIDPLRPTTDLYLAVVNHELKIAEDNKESPEAIARILAYKIRMLASKLDMGAFLKLIPDYGRSFGTMEI